MSLYDDRYASFAKTNHRDPTESPEIVSMVSDAWDQSIVAAQSISDIGKLTSLLRTRTNIISTSK